LPAAIVEQLCDIKDDDAAKERCLACRRAARRYLPRFFFAGAESGTGVKQKHGIDGRASPRQSDSAYVDFGHRLFTQYERENGWKARDLFRNDGGLNALQH
jgi:hypothetical protein